MKRKKPLRELFNLQGGLCAYCDTPMDMNSCNRPNSPTIDHIIPKSAGGCESRFNKVCVCKQCNNEKGSMPLAMFLVQLRYRGINAP